MPLLALKARIEVHAGVIFEESLAEHHRTWSYTSADYEADKAVPADQPTAFSKMLDEAHEYAKGLSNPAYVNWVRVYWLWL
jgi:hypothetical protein